MHCFGWCTDGRSGFQWGAGLLASFRPREDKRTISDINTGISFELNLTAPTYLSLLSNSPSCRL